MKGQWIWFPHEFEFLLYYKVMHRRTNRSKLVTPSWRVDTLYPDIVFKKKFFLKEDCVCEIYAEGELSVFLDGIFNLHPIENGKIRIGKGEHELMATVHNAPGLPCLLIRGEELFTDGSWLTCCGTNDWLPAGCREFSTPQDSPNAYRLPTRPVEVCAEEKTPQGILYDFGREMLAYTSVRGISGAGRLSLYYGETREEALDFEYSETCDFFRIDGETEILAETKAYRYVHVICEGVSYAKISALEEYRPMEHRGTFSCSDPEINDIYAMALRTMELNFREVMLDGIKRDRWLWAGDLFASLYYNYYSCFDVELTETSLIALFGKTPPEIHTNFILDYSFFMIISLYEHYRFTGRKAFIQKMFQKAVWLMDYCFQECDEEGFVLSKPGVWVFVDWAPMENDGRVAFEQVLLLKSLECMADMAELIGDDRGHFYREKFDALQKKFVEIYWQNDKLCLAHTICKDGSPCARSTRYAEIFALKYDYLQGAHRKAAVEKLLGSESQRIVTPYMKSHEMDTLGKVGFVSEMVDGIREYWGNMRKAGAECVWEEFDPKNPKSLGMVSLGHRYGNSKCHAWGAGAVSLLPRYVAGISPNREGYGTGFVMRPALHIFKSFDAYVPVPGGGVSVSWENWTLRIKPKGISGILFAEEAWLSVGGTIVSAQKDSDGGYAYQLSADNEYVFYVNYVNEDAENSTASGHGIA